MKRFISLVSAIAVFGMTIPAPVYAAPPPVIRESVGVCDYNAPTHCAAPNTDGSVNVKVTGGTGGTVTVNQGTAGASPWPVKIDQTTPGTTNGVQINAPVPAGTNVIGHVIGDTANYSSTNASTTVTLGGTYQTVFTSSGTRHGCLIQNPITATEALSIRQGSSAVWTINAGGSFNCAFPGGVVTDLIEVTAATTGHAFTAVSQ